MPTSRHARSIRDCSSCALAAHTNADHAHHTRARTSIASPNRAQLVSCASSVVTWVTAKTKTRSHSNSTGVVRRSAAGSAGVGAGRSSAGSCATVASLTHTKYRGAGGARLIGYRA